MISFISTSSPFLRRFVLAHHLRVQIIFSDIFIDAQRQASVAAVEHGGTAVNWKLMLGC